MTNKEMLSEKYARLRRLAEKRIKKWSDFVSQEHDDLLRVIHELKIHLAEQEIRNEELKQEMAIDREKDELRYESICNMIWPLSQNLKGENMKKKMIIKRLFVGLILFAFMAGCAGTMHRESTGEYIDDSVITTKVKAEIFGDPMLKTFQISVETFKGVVQLSGFVNSAEISARAAKVAKAVKGVESVKNNLVVK